ncbi:MAG: hypothetical protein ABI645_05005 [Pseudomonadota bacterium]
MELHIDEAQQGPHADAKPARPASAKAQARQAQREDAEKEVRQRKTLLMQRVNQAYEARDLLTLLTLQLLT